MEDDNRSLNEISMEIKIRTRLLGLVVIVRRLSLLILIGTSVMTIYNIIRWIINGVGINSRCMAILMWFGISVIGLLFYNFLQGFSLSLVQSIIKDKELLNKL